MAKNKTEQEFNIRHRLVGACVLLALGVIFIPMILQGNGPGGVMKSDNLTEEVQEWIVGTEEAGTYVSRVVPVGENALQTQNEQPVVIDENALPELQVIEENTTAIDQSSQQQIQTITEVEVAAVEPTEQPAAQEVVEEQAPQTQQFASLKADNVSRGWVVQVGTFSKPENAQNLITNLNQNGFDSRYEVIDTDAGQATRVWVGPYEKRVTAARALETVKEKTGVKGFLKSFP